MKRLFLVKREVYADSIEKALSTKGKIYEILLADERFQPEKTNQNRALIPRKNESSTR